jgi:hypothetical protein
MLIHPERKNRQEEMAATKEEVEQLLRKLFKGGPVERVPRNRKDSEVFLALAASRIESRAVLTESEVNDQLSDWLGGLADPHYLDHVTVRRYLVDFGMLFRDPEGHSYRANQAVISRYIDAAARAVVPVTILQEVKQDRSARRRASQANG